MMKKMSKQIEATRHTRKILLLSHVSHRVFGFFFLYFECLFLSLAIVACVCNDDAETLLRKLIYHAIVKWRCAEFFPVFSAFRVLMMELSETN